jgi:hypothetical protein
MTRTQGPNLGQDKFGKFRIEGGQECPVCRTEEQWCITYTSTAKIEDYAKRAPGLILKRADRLDRTPILWRRIGITCGCYGKLHRQVAHITDNGKDE